MRRKRESVNRSDHSVVLHDVRRVYGRGSNAVTALDGISISFARGTFTAVMGPSGSGKSTLPALRRRPRPADRRARVAIDGPDARRPERSAS